MDISTTQFVVVLSNDFNAKIQDGKMIFHANSLAQKYLCCIFHGDQNAFKLSGVLART